MAKKASIERWKRDAASPKFKVRFHNRCRLCGRPRAYLRKFGMCRICFRTNAAEGRQILADAAPPNLHVSPTMLEAATLAVELAA